MVVFKIMKRMLICLVVVEILLKYIQKHFGHGSYSDRGLVLKR